MNRCLSSSAAAVALTVTAGVVSVQAQDYPPPARTTMARGPNLPGPYVLDRRSLGDRPIDVVRFPLARDSAQEGNAGQPNFPVQQYGETSGGPAQ